MSIPVLRATKSDQAVRQLLLSELINQVVKDGGSIIMPNTARIQPVEEEKFQKYKDTLSGIN